MADIIIRGMEMPQVGDKIEFVQNIAGHIYARFKPSKGYMCEVIPLPEGHGRLGDLDDALNRIPIPTGGISSVDIYNNIKYFIETRPTIVPAEGDGE